MPTVIRESWKDIFMGLAVAIVFVMSSYSSLVSTKTDTRVKSLEEQRPLWIAKIKEAMEKEVKKHEADKHNGTSTH